MDISDKVNAVVNKVNELDRRVGALEEHDKKSWVFSTKIFKRALGIWFNIFFLFLILAFIGFGIYGLMSIFGGGGEASARGGGDLRFEI